jgi:hypothetical protein
MHLIATQQCILVTKTSTIHEVVEIRLSETTLDSFAATRGCFCATDGGCGAEGNGLSHWDSIHVR